MLGYGGATGWSMIRTSETAVFCAIRASSYRCCSVLYRLVVVATLRSRRASSVARFGTARRLSAVPATSWLRLCVLRESWLSNPSASWGIVPRRICEISFSSWTTGGYASVYRLRSVRSWVCLSSRSLKAAIRLGDWLITGSSSNPVRAPELSVAKEIRRSTDARSARVVASWLCALLNRLSVGSPLPAPGAPVPPAAACPPGSVMVRTWNASSCCSAVFSDWDAALTCCSRTCVNCVSRSCCSDEASCT